MADNKLHHKQSVNAFLFFIVKVNYTLKDKETARCVVLRLRLWQSCENKDQWKEVIDLCVD